MSACPKCGSPLAGGETECPACGVILAKARPTSARVTPIAVPLPAPPPAAETVYGGPEPADAPGAVAAAISPQTLEALTRLRPWLRFMAGYGSVVSALMACAAFVSLFAAFSKPQLLAVTIAYGLYSVIGFSVIGPLHRASDAILQISALGPRAAVEAFAVEQGAFWRRIGLVTAISLGLALLLLALAGLLFGVLRASGGLR